MLEPTLKSPDLHLGRTETEPDGLAVATRQHTVLIIEDHPDVNQALAIRFRHAGMKAVTALDGAKGVDAALRDRPDAIILDLGLPGLTGIDVIRLLRCSEETRHIPILVLTGRKEVELFDLLNSRTGIRRLFYKPTPAVKLIEAVQSILEST